MTPMAADAVDWRTSGLDPELVRALRPPGEMGELPLTYSDYRLIADLCDIAGECHPADQALLLALLVARDEGSLCIRVESDAVKRRLEPVLADGEAEAWAGRIARRLADLPEAARLYGSPGDLSRPLIDLTIGPRRYVYFQRYYLAAAQLRERVQGRLSDVQPPIQGDWPRILREVVRDAPQRLPSGEPLIPSADQVAALALALSRQFVVISGGPGTGKTSTVCALLRCLVRAGVRADDIALAAPSGRAAQRMTEALHAGIGSIDTPSEGDRSLLSAAGSTLHRLLGYNPRTGGFWRGPDDPIEGRVVVIDEVSMVDAELMRHLVEAAPLDAKLLLLGDKDQLPSVESGAVLSDLIPDGSGSTLSGEVRDLIGECCRAVGVREPKLPAGCETATTRDAVAILTTNHRSGCGIRHIAERIVAGDPPEEIVHALPAAPAEAEALLEWLSGAAAEGCALIPDGVMSLGECAERWVEGYLAAAGEFGSLLKAASGVALPPVLEDVEVRECAEALLASVERGRILTLLRRGPHGAEGVNRRLVAFHGGQWGRAYAGMPVLVTRNDGPLGLWNGDVGVIVRDRRRRLLALFRKPEGIRAYPERDLPPWSPAYAMTVHKAQGSEYDRVLLVVPPEGGERLLSREMVYTALTRAKRLVAVHSQAPPLVAALSRRIERDTGIGLL